MLTNFLISIITLDLGHLQSLCCMNPLTSLLSGREQKEQRAYLSWARAVLSTQEVLNMKFNTDSIWQLVKNIYIINRLFKFHMYLTSPEKSLLAGIFSKKSVTLKLLRATDLLPAFQTPCISNLRLHYFFCPPHPTVDLYLA